MFIYIIYETREFNLFLTPWKRYLICSILIRKNLWIITCIVLFCLYYYAFFTLNMNVLTFALSWMICNLHQTVTPYPFFLLYSKGIFFKLLIINPYLQAFWKIHLIKFSNCIYLILLLDALLNMNILKSSTVLIMTFHRDF